MHDGGAARVGGAGLDFGRAGLSVAASPVSILRPRVVLRLVRRLGLRLVILAQWKNTNCSGMRFAALRLVLVACVYRAAICGFSLRMGSARALRTWRGWITIGVKSATVVG